MAASTRDCSGILSASLQRVAYGYSLAAIAGIALGTLVGQSVWAMRGLDPLFQVLRTIPPLAWLPPVAAAFRDGQPSAIFVIFITSIWPIIINAAVGIRNIPQISQRRGRGAAQSAGVLLQDHDSGRGAVHLHGPAHQDRPVLACDRRGEMLIGGVGIDFFIWDAWNSPRHISEIILALFYVGIIGFVARSPDRGAGQVRDPRHRRQLKEHFIPGLSEARPHRQILHPRQRRPGAEGHQPDDRERANASRSSAIPAAANPRCSTSSPASPARPMAGVL